MGIEEMIQLYTYEDMLKNLKNSPKPYLVEKMDPVMIEKIIQYGIELDQFEYIKELALKESFSQVSYTGKSIGCQIISDINDACRYLRDLNQEHELDMKREW